MKKPHLPIPEKNDCQQNTPLWIVKLIKQNTPRCTAEMDQIHDNSVHKKRALCGEDNSLKLLLLYS